MSREVSDGARQIDEQEFRRQVLARLGDILLELHHPPEQQMTVEHRHLHTLDHSVKAAIWAVAGSVAVIAILGLAVAILSMHRP